MTIITEENPVKKIRLNVKGVKSLTNKELGVLLNIDTRRMVHLERLDVIPTRISLMVKEKTMVDNCVFIIAGGSSNTDKKLTTFSNWMKTPKVKDDKTDSFRSTFKKMSKFKNTTIVILHYNDRISQLDVTRNWKTQNAEFYS